MASEVVPPVFLAKLPYFIACLLLLPIVVLLTLLVPYAFHSSRPKSFPPGPSTIPVLGNLHLIPASRSYVLFHEWRQKYGSMIGLKFGPTNFVILNDFRDVEALFEKRGAIYSSRPANYIAQELICPDDVHMLFAAYGPGWKLLRRIASTLLSAKRTQDLLPTQNAEATQTVYDMIRDPENFDRHIKRLTTSIYLCMVYGQRGTRYESPTIQALYDVQVRFTSIVEPGAAPPVDGLTFLQWTPTWLAPWKRAAAQIRRDHQKLYLGLLRETRKRVEAGEGTGCFMEGMIADQEKTGLGDQNMAYAGGAMMEAASDTTSSTLLSFILGLLTNPAVLKKAQADVDAVCGDQRSPGLEDVGKFPYIEACVLETLRWRPAAPGGVPHMLTQQDTYKDYVFPAGTVFLANAWSIHRGEDEYSDPEDFVPERWLDNNHFGLKSDGVVKEHQQRKQTYAFGAGRRICAGQNMAENSLRIAMAKLVWTFDFRTGKSGKVDASPLTAYEGGFAVCPKKFDASITPRSKKRAEVIEREFHELKPFFEQFVNV
ncbi:putative Cytochrome P450 [Seiridium cardinale]|uniref:Cytochrome P450 n=1 Tax=Seiridium cardinale TaxID=138064 RepID=A0ABR2X5H2_9PEZI